MLLMRNTFYNNSTKVVLPSRFTDWETDFSEVKWFSWDYTVAM